MKPPLENHQADLQRTLLDHGTREQIIAWLCWNDPNGTYTDRDSLAEGMRTIVLEEARQIMRDQVNRDRSILQSNTTMDE